MEASGVPVELVVVGGVALGLFWATALMLTAITG